MYWRSLYLISKTANNIWILKSYCVEPSSCSIRSFFCVPSRLKNCSFSQNRNQILFSSDFAKMSVWPVDRAVGATHHWQFASPVNFCLFAIDWTCLCVCVRDRRTLSRCSNESIRICICASVCVWVTWIAYCNTHFEFIYAYSNRMLFFCNILCVRNFTYSLCTLTESTDTSRQQQASSTS